MGQLPHANHPGLVRTIALLAAESVTQWLLIFAGLRYSEAENRMKSRVASTIIEDQRLKKGVKTEARIGKVCDEESEDRILGDIPVLIASHRRQLQALSTAPTLFLMLQMDAFANFFGALTSSSCL